MNTNRVELPANFLSRVDLRRMYPDKHGNPIMVHCPEHGDRGKPNLGVYPQNVFCFVCRWHAGVLEYIQRVQGTNMHDTLEFAKTLMQERPVAVGAAVAMRVQTEPLERSVAAQYTRNMGERHYRFLQARYGLSRETVEGARIGHTGQFPYAYTIPVYDLDGELLNIRFRADPRLMKDTDTRYWGMAGRNGTQLYMPPQLLDMPGESLADRVRSYGSRFAWCYLTEGEFDALAMMQLTGCPAVSTTNGARAFQNPPRELWDLMDSVRWMVAYDQDETGRDAGEKVARLLAKRYGRENVKTVTWNPKEGKDASELLASGIDRTYGAGGLEWWDDIFSIRPLDITSVL